jgi:RNA polymerase sigma-70 factor, ECF subfamily
LQELAAGHFFELIRSKPDEALHYIYSSYYVLLCNQVFVLLKEKQPSEDIVQEVISDLWVKKDQININQAIFPYLKRACRNRALNYIRDTKKWKNESEEIFLVIDNSINKDVELETNELQKMITSTISQLPEKCRIVFSLSRFEEMSYQEIADHLDISVKTVENHISKALKILREKVYQNSIYE